jgi:phosphoglycerate kinase
VAAADRRPLRALGDLECGGKRVLMRCDFNVPLQDGAVTSDHRLRMALPGIRAVLEAGGAPLLCSHLGRPTGKDPALSLAPVAARLGALLGQEVTLLPGCDEPEVAEQVRALEPGRVALLENLRWYPGEKRGDAAFAQALAALADCYVDDAFGTAHRGDASVAVVPTLLPSAAGPLLQNEVDTLEGLLAAPPRPFVALLGGAKVEDKIPVIDNLLPVVNSICIGGGMAYTFLKAQGIAIGDSLCVDAEVDHCRARLERAKELGVAILLPTDHRCHTEFADTDAPVLATGDVPDGTMALDIGDATAARYADTVTAAGAVVWNGPMGVFEMRAFAPGTRIVAEALAASDAQSVVGGGDSAAAAEQFGVADRMSHISTGGGASLALLAGQPLPGVEPLRVR